MGIQGIPALNCGLADVQQGAPVPVFGNQVTKGVKLPDIGHARREIGAESECDVPVASLVQSFDGLSTGRAEGRAAVIPTLRS